MLQDSIFQRRRPGSRQQVFAEGSKPKLLNFCNLSKPSFPVAAPRFFSFSSVQGVAPSADRSWKTEGDSTRLRSTPFLPSRRTLDYTQGATHRHCRCFRYEFQPCFFMFQQGTVGLARTVIVAVPSRHANLLHETLPRSSLKATDDRFLWNAYS